VSSSSCIICNSSTATVSTASVLSKTPAKYKPRRVVPIRVTVKKVSLKIRVFHAGVSTGAESSDTTYLTFGKFTFETILWSKICRLVF